MGTPALRHLVEQRTLHGLLVPLAHRVGRRRTGRTVHLELLPRVEHGG